MRGMTNSPFTGHWTFGLQLDLEVTSQSANANEAFDRDLLCKQKKTTIIELHYVPKLCNVVPLFWFEMTWTMKGLSTLANPLVPNCKLAQKNKQHERTVNSQF